MNIELALRKILRILPDRIYIRIQYYYHFKRFPNLKSPKTFNEKLQWLKLHDRRPEYTMMVDKYAVREYISKTIGDEHLVPLLGVWDSPDEIDFDALPEQFVLKCNHDSGSIVICKDKDNFDKEAAVKKLRKGINRNGYWYGREWPYKSVQPKIIAEQYMEDEETGELRDYKFFCFDGRPDCVMLCVDRSIGDPKFYFFDADWQLKRLNLRAQNLEENFSLPKPKCINKMFELASLLSTGVPFSRIDLYQCDGKVYFGEITFYPASGFDANLLPSTDKYFGDLIKTFP